MQIVETFEANLPFVPAEVWQVAGAFGALHYFHSGTVDSTLLDGGRLRLLTTVDGGLLWERLLNFDHEQMSYRYLIAHTKSMKDCPYGEGYIGEVKVLEAKSGATRYRYRGTFEPLPGYDETQGRNAVISFARDCVSGLELLLRNQVQPVFS